MLIKWGALVVNGSGKIGGQVASSNAAGSILRTKVTPSNGQSPSQSAVRSRLASISQSWAGLAEAQRTAWNNAVSSFTSTNIFGDTVTPSGFNLYQKINNNLLLIGEDMIDTPPSPSSVQALVSLSATAVNLTGVVTLTFADAIEAGTTFKVFATDAINAGISFVKSEYRLIGTIDSGDISPFIATTLYNAKFGAVGSVGKKIFFKVVGVNNTTGQEGVGLKAVAVIS